MIRKFNTLILLVALVSLPLRGMAAAAMWHCVQGPGEAISLTAAQAAGHHAPHHHAPPNHTQDHAAADQAAHGASDGDSPAGGNSHHTGSLCIVGTGAAVAPSEWQAFSFAPIGADRIPFFAQRFTGVVPAQLDRPPLLQSL